MWIDAHAFSHKFERTEIAVSAGHYVPGLVSSLGLVMCAPVSPSLRL